MTLVNKLLIPFREIPYTITLVIIFGIIGFSLTYYIGYTWLQPSNEKEYDKYCPGWREDTTKPCGLIIEPSPIYLFIPLGSIVAGISLGCKLDSRSWTQSQGGKEE